MTKYTRLGRSMPDHLIVFDKADKVYSPGECVSGRIYLQLGIPQRVTGIFAEFKGYSEIKSKRASWWRQICDEISEIPAEDRIKQEHFNHSYFILGSQDGCEMYLQAGRQCFPFTCMLPKGIPHSYECKGGFVRYTITVSLMRMIDFDKQIQAEFKVATPVNLSDFPESQRPIKLHKEISFYEFCFSIVPIMLDLQVDNSAYCPGDTLYYDLVCQNKSSTHITQVKISIARVTTFLSKNKPSYLIETIWMRGLGKVNKRRCKEWKDEIVIPKDLIPSHLEYCKLMNVDYLLRVSCYSRLLHTKLIVEKPILIGTVPYGRVYQMNPAPKPEDNKIKCTFAGKGIDPFEIEF